ncbi:solute symporter family transporter [Glarea lozoyensis ATCC 20868]|uniref:Solute symporter family transporter n=1 Tax=Glarea lozoyensis (strain ATCC 20868 / MF5171) TaxID=1116229 RepID=S3DEH4_GLAL2|nr:solute symporter family transporter [Glarea lozoyensis ATCC 20868]EPE36160.1 solute symporter family transporter [Glarea lozoyensis ATCC 20868]
MATETIPPTLPQGAGYGVVVGIGFFFAFLMAGISYVQNRYTKYSTKTSEEFNTASRSIKSGLIASGIVSAWTWAATLLQSCTVAYSYDAAGATVQIFMFAILACKVKQNAPRCHTFLEIIQKRYGTTAHIVFIFFALFCNILVASQLLLGGSAVVTALTGMNVYAAIFLIPLGVVVYVVLGGLRATFLCDFTHTFILLIIILYFMFSVYTTNPLIGSPDRMYEILTEASKLRPVAGNQDGSYLTLKSNFGLIFGVIQLCSGMGTVFLDQGYWQRAIASRPTTAVRAYIMGGMAWFAIPFGFATTLGLAAVALTDNPSFPTYPNPMSTSQVSSGLAAPFGAVALLGNNGAIALLITLFMAVTSSSSSELIAVSSILTFDIYKMYINPSATPSQLIKTSHYMICFFGFVMAAFACIWNAIGIDLGWLFLTMGLLIGGGVFPAAFAVTWKKQSKWGAITGAVGGLACGLTAWLVTAHAYYGELTIATTGANYPTLAGNLAAVLMGCLITVTVSLVKPDNFDWEITRSINAAPQIIEAQSNDPLATSHNTSEKPSPSPTPSSHTPPPSHTFTPSPLPPPPSDDDAILTNPKLLNRSFKYACYSALILTLLMDFIIPIPMFLSHYIFSRGFFLGWIVIGFLWVAFALGVCGILPVWEGRGFLGGLWGRR